MSLLTNVDDKRNFRVGEDQAFVLSNGEQLFTLDQLSEAINLIEPDVFRAHVNEQKNDFAAWVEGVFEEHSLAEQLRQHPTPLRMMVSIEKFLRQPSSDGSAPMEATPDAAAPVQQLPEMNANEQQGYDQHAA